MGDCLKDSGCKAWSHCHGNGGIGTGEAVAGGGPGGGRCGGRGRRGPGVAGATGMSGPGDGI